MILDHMDWRSRTDHAIEQLDELAAGATPASRIEALRDHLSAAAARIVELEAKAFAPGVWRCAKCQLKLIAQTLGVSGAAGDTAPQPCPNHCGPMWRVSWADEARGAIDAYDREFDAHKAAVADRDELLRILETMDTDNLYAEDQPIYDAIKTRIAGANG